MRRYAPVQVTDDDTGEHVGQGGRVMVVDDDRTTRAVHRAILATHYDVITAGSGEEAVEQCRIHTPDLVVLDVMMPGMNGYETCRKLREFTSVPILFVTGSTSLDENLEAFDAGGNDIISKPVNRDLFLRKVGVVIHQYKAAASLAEEKHALERMAMGFLSSVSQSGVLLNFMRNSVACQDYRELASQLLTATRDLGLECCLMIRHEGGEVTATDRGEPSPIEVSILNNAAEMGRLFQFKTRLVVNYDRVSIIVSNMPSESAEAERSGILRDSLAILAETAEALAINVDIRQAANKRAEQLQLALSEAESVLVSMGEQHRVMLLDIRLLLQELAESIEKSYSWLDTTQAQEATISTTLDQSIKRILGRIQTGGNFDEQFSQVITALKSGQAQNAGMIQD